MMRNLIIAVALLAAFARAGTITATSPSFADVSNAVVQAGVGGTVLIPVGSATWTNLLYLTNGINIIGAGTNATFITNAIPWGGVYPGSGSGIDDNRPPPLFYVRALSSNQQFRFSGINASCNWVGGSTGGQFIWFHQISIAANPIIPSFRIDHCYVDKAYRRGLWFQGSVYGVVDHCTIANCYVPMGGDAADQAEWNRFVGTEPYYGLGTTTTRVMEDCTILWNNEYPSTWGPLPADCGQGGHYVVRHCVITNAGGFSATLDGFDLHGNNHLYSYDGRRGSIFFEFYNNKMYSADNQLDRAMNLRGGTCMVFSNEFYGSKAFSIMLNEEETWANYCYDQPLVRPLHVLTNAPAQDQVTNSFFWANTRNGSPLISEPTLYAADPELNPITAGTTNNPIAICIQENRDYWKHSPWQTPYTNQGGQVNAMIGYTPLTYPHPRVTQDDATPASSPRYLMIRR